MTATVFGIGQKLDRDSLDTAPLNIGFVYHPEPVFSFRWVTCLCRRLGTMKPSSRTKQLTVRINEQDRRRLHLAAADLKITVTDMVKTALTTTYGVELNG